MIYSCCNENRKSAVLKSAVLNGIDYLEVLDQDAVALDSPRQRTLLIHCLKAAPSALTPRNVLIQGGESITNISVDWVAPASTSPPLLTNPKEQSYFQSLPDAANVLVVRTGQAGDFSPYKLRLVNDATQALEDPFAVTEVLIGFDPQLAEVEFSFKVECGPNFDCAPQPTQCPPSGPAPPPINYLAKDYGSFRTVILDRLSQLLPGWAGTSEANLGVALAELIAYVGDHLSYQQDAVATEAYLGTARSRISLRRHALLVDYHVHDGANARAWIQLQVAGNPGDAIFLDRSLTRFYTFAPGMPSSFAIGSNNEEAALLSGVQVFEPMCDAVLYPEHDKIPFYTWGDTDCCLPNGSTEATLAGSYPNLHPGDVLIFQEMKGPQTGDPADADIRRRCAVRLTQVAMLVDPLFTGEDGKPVPVTEIQWSQEDALPFAVCISSSYLDSGGDQQTAADVSVAFGNVVLADHGLSFSGKDFGAVPAPTLFFPRDPAADRCQLSPLTPLPVRFRPSVPDSPLTQAVPLPAVSLPAAGVPITPAPVLLGAAGVVSLKDSKGFTCLTLGATNPSGWPQLFGVVVAANGANPAHFDVSVVYNPPGGAAGIQQRVVVEQFTDLSLQPADPNYVATVINSASQLIRVPASYVPPGSPPAGFPATPTMLPNSGTVDLQDLGSPPKTYLTLEATNPSGWTLLFGVTAQPDPNPVLFDLQVVYAPSSGSVTVEKFANLSLATTAGEVNGKSALISVQSFARTAAGGVSAYALVHFDPSAAVPVIALSGTLNARTAKWSPVQDLLGSAESDLVFVVEVESDGIATLRFGDNTNGRAPDTGTAFDGSYRIGNGTAGNVGADSLIFLAVADGRIRACRNPLPAAGGADPETNDQIRRRAPQAFLTQERAITMADYEAVAEGNPQVSQAVASLRWTGSWYTVFIAADPQGGGNPAPALQTTLKRTEERYRLAGQDLELAPPLYVPLQIALEVCVDPNYFRSDVQRALLQVLGRLFSPDNFTFGQTVFLSPIYAAARFVAGITAVRAVTFQPQGVNSTAYLSAGEIKLGPLQIARLDNDPNFPNHGQLTLLMEGGK
jgi:Baseplate J-like protein